MLRSADLFPLPACEINSAACSIPDLPQPRLDHSLSLLPGGRLVVCGGRDFDSYSGQFLTLDTCISWSAGESTWTYLYTMRCINNNICVAYVIPMIMLIAMQMVTGWPDPFTRPGRRQRILTRCFSLEGERAQQISLSSFCPRIRWVSRQIQKLKNFFFNFFFRYILCIGTWRIWSVRNPRR